MCPARCFQTALRAIGLNRLVGLIEEDSRWTVQCGWSDIQAPKHAAGVFAYETAGHAGEAHEGKGCEDTWPWVAMWEVVKLGEKEKMCVAGRSAMH